MSILLENNFENQKKNKFGQALKNGAVTAFLTVNCFSFVEGALTVAEARQNTSVADIQTESVVDSAKLAFFSTVHGGIDAAISGFHNAGVAAFEPCERSYLMSCKATSLVSDNEGINQPQLAYQIAGLPGYIVGGAVAGLVDGTVGVPKMNNLPY